MTTSTTTANGSTETSHKTQAPCRCILDDRKCICGGVISSATTRRKIDRLVDNAIYQYISHHVTKPQKFPEYLRLENLLVLPPSAYALVQAWTRSSRHRLCLLMANARYAFKVIKKHRQSLCVEVALHYSLNENCDKSCYARIRVPPLYILVRHGVILNVPL
jgi:hypothetical protein